MQRNTFTQTSKSLGGQSILRIKTLRLEALKNKEK